MPTELIRRHALSLKSALEAVAGSGPVERSGAGEHLWREVYDELGDDDPTGFSASPWPAAPAMSCGSR